MIKHYYPRYEWYFDPRKQQYIHLKVPDERAMTLDDCEIIVSLTRLAYESLKDWMVDNDPHGVIRTDRKEDLKVIHRLLDIMEK